MEPTSALGTRRLGAEGPTVGAIGLGCMPLSFGYVDAPSEDDPVALVQRAIELGVTFFDTADVYGPFTNEEAVGSALRGRREEVTLATKVGLLVGPNGGYPLSSDARPERIAVEVDASLRRLRHRPHRPVLPAPGRSEGAVGGLLGRAGRRWCAPARSVPSVCAKWASISSISCRRSIPSAPYSPNSRCGRGTHSPRSCRGAPPTVPRSSRSHRWGEGS